MSGSDQKSDCSSSESETSAVPQFSWTTLYLELLMTLNKERETTERLRIEINLRDEEVKLLRIEKSNMEVQLKRVEAQAKHIAAQYETVVAEKLKLNLELAKSTEQLGKQTNQEILDMKEWLFVEINKNKQEHQFAQLGSKIDQLEKKTEKVLQEDQFAQLGSKIDKLEMKAKKVLQEDQFAKLGSKIDKLEKKTEKVFIAGPYGRNFQFCSSLKRPIVVKDEKPDINAELKQFPSKKRVLREGKSARATSSIRSSKFLSSINKTGENAEICVLHLD